MQRADARGGARAAAANRLPQAGTPASRRQAFVRRVRVVFTLFLACFALVIGRAVQLQIFDHDHLQKLAEEQYLNTVKVPARRGQVLDRNGSALAISVDVPSVFANPRAIIEPRATARQLAPILGTDAKSLGDRLSADRYFTWLKRQVEPAVAAKVAALHISGVGITKEPRRFYPNREIGAHVVGFSGMDARGLEGIEKAYDGDLLGEMQAVPAVRDARGHAVLAGGLDPYLRSHGNDVRLTLDLQLQHSSQAALETVMQATRAKSATAVVLDVATAEVLAMAVVPTFNPNQGAQEKADRRRNRVVTDLFEPGSTLKPWVVGAALDLHAVGPQTVFFCENGRMAIGGHTISDTSPHGWMNLTEILAKSSNIGMAKIAQAMGRNQLDAALRSVGIARRTGIELPGEVAGLLRPARQWSDLDTATIAFGQGVAVNGVQLAAIYRALAAGGMFKEPRLVRALERPDGSKMALPKVAERRVLSADAARRVTAMLESSVTPKEGTGRLAAVPGYRVAGKTGTAQKADPVTGGYSRDRYVALFAGYLPADAPKVVIVVAVDEPQNSHFGGTIAAPVFAEIGAAAMQRLGIPPNMPIAAPALASNTARLDAAARGTAPTEEPAQVDSVEAPPVVLPPGSVPSFKGLTSRQAVEQFGQLGQGWDLVMQGTGTVAEQDPSPGTPRRQGKRVLLTLRP